MSQWDEGKKKGIYIFFFLKGVVKKKKKKKKIFLGKTLSKNSTLYKLSYLEKEKEKKKKALFITTPTRPCREPSRVPLPKEIFFFLSFSNSKIFFFSFFLVCFIFFLYILFFFSFIF